MFTMFLGGRRLSSNIIDPYDCSNDPYWANVVLLMHMDDELGNVKFIEEKGKIVTVNGNSKLVSTQSKFGGYSGYFDGTGDYLSIPGSTDFSLEN